MKNLLMRHKRITGVVSLFAIAIVVIVFPVNVRGVTWCATPGTEEKKNQLNNSMIERYGIKIEQDASDSLCFDVTMTPENRDAHPGLCDGIEFQLTKANTENVDHPENYKLTCDGEPLHYCVANEDVLKAGELDSGLKGIKMTFKAQQPLIKDEALRGKSGSCFYNNVEIVMEASAEGNVGYLPIDRDSCIKATDSDINDFKLHKLNMDPLVCGVNDNTDFKKAFCADKQAAIDEGNNKTLTTASYTGDTLQFYCDYDVQTIPIRTEEIKGENYFLNKKHLYAIGPKVQAATATYTKNLYPGYGDQEAQTVACEVQCEEAVSIEYGPPVAITAGLCFEYNVRVTSRVVCSATAPPPEPELECGYCTPVPYCTHGSGWEGRQGGPNEDFDSCVQSCDGGKYTKKCSNKCYKEVYGTSATAQAKINNRFYEDATATRLASQTEVDATVEQAALAGYKIYGAHFVATTADGSKYIDWKDATYDKNEHYYGSLNATGEGRWYTDREGRFHNGEFTTELGHGFWRKDYGGGSICQDPCSWIGCPYNQYLNPGSGRADYKKNVQAYNEMIDNCKKYMKCSTTTAEFTIDTSYKDIGGTTHEYHFPHYSNDDEDNWSKDTITPNANSTSVVSTAKQEGTTIKFNYPEEGQGVWGCYSDASTKKSLYRTTWGFPGSWMDGKKAQIAYTPPADEDGWVPYDEKFCLPLDADDVNSVWWNQRMKWIKLKIGGTYSHESSTYNDICGEGRSDDYSIAGILSWQLVDKYVQLRYPTYKINWNITAHTRNFGYFDWPIDINCFYAVSSDPNCPEDCCVEDKCKSDIDWHTDEYNEKCIDNEDPYVRSTDNETLFPAEIGETTGSREPGFNWSQYAVNRKNDLFQSDPVAYRNKIESLGAQGVYDDAYLDYDFILYPSDLRSIRDVSLGLTPNSKYTAFDSSGFYQDEYGLYRYRSDFIRNRIGGTKHIPESAISCNNIDGGSCDPIHGDAG